MDIIEQKINTKDYLTKSNLPASDYVINPYVGCTHACKYCYARFMKRFTGHREEWGKFIDIKQCEKPINLKKLKGKSVFMSSKVLIEKATLRLDILFNNSTSRKISVDFVEIVIWQSAFTSCSNICLVMPYFSS